MTDTIALVTGANKGIGRETVAQLARLGMTVLLAARDPALGTAAAEELRADGADVHPITLDVTDPATIKAAVEHVEDRFGRLDVLINNAGITGSSRGPASRTDLDVMRMVFETNVFGVVAVTNAFLPLLLGSAAPRIVNMSSSVGSLSEMSDVDGPLAGMPPWIPYTASKTALNSVTVQYAKEFRGTKLLVNAGCPGYTATDLNHHTGTRTVVQGAAISVHLATLPAGGPHGTFVNDDGPVPW